MSRSGLVENHLAHALKETKARNDYPIKTKNLSS